MSDTERRRIRSIAVSLAQMHVAKDPKDGTPIYHTPSPPGGHGDSSCWPRFVYADALEAALVNEHERGRRLADEPT